MTSCAANRATLHLRTFRRVAGPAVAIGIALMMVACGKKDYVMPLEPPYAIRIEPATAVAAEGRVVRFLAIVNREVGSTTFNFWSVQGGCAGVINQPPGVSADVHVWSGPCTTVVSVVNWSYQLDSIARAVLITRPVSPKSLEVVPGTLTVEAGAFELLVPLLKDSVGVELQRTAIAWSVADPSVAAVTWAPGGGFGGSGAARVDGVAPGRTQVTATFAGLSAQAWVDVIPAAPRLP